MGLVSSGRGRVAIGGSAAFEHWLRAHHSWIGPSKNVSRTGAARSGDDPGPAKVGCGDTFFDRCNPG